MTNYRAAQAAVDAARGRGHAAGLARRNEPAPPSLVGQATDLARALPAGLLGMGRDMATDVVGIGRTAWNAPRLVRGDLPRHKAEEWFPFMTGMGRSMRDTGGRAGQLAASLAPGGMAPSDTEYGQAIREGRILGAVVEDVGNVAIVGSAAAAGARGAAGRAQAHAATARDAAARPSAPPGATGRAERATGRADRVRRVADQATRVTSGLNVVADAPARLFTVPAGFAARHVAAPAGRALARTDRGQAVVGAVDQARTARRTRREFRADVVDSLKDAQIEISRSQGFAGQAAVRAAAAAARDIGVSPEAVQAAALLDRSGLGPVLIDTRRALARAEGHAPGITQRIERAMLGIERELALPEGTIPLLEQLRDGTLDPAVAARLAESTAPLVERLLAAEQSRLEGTGRRTGPLDPAHTGRAPMPSKIAYRLRGLTDRIEQLQAELAGAGPEDPGLRGQAARARAAADQVRERAAAGARIPAETARLLAAGRLEGRVEGLERGAELTGRRAERPMPSQPAPGGERLVRYQRAAEARARAEGRAEATRQAGERVAEAGRRVEQPDPVLRREQQVQRLAEGYARMLPEHLRPPPGRRVLTDPGRAEPILARADARYGRAEAEAARAATRGAQARDRIRAEAAAGHGRLSIDGDGDWWLPEGSEPVARPIDPDAPVTAAEARVARAALDDLVGPAGRAAAARATVTLPGDIDVPRIPREWTPQHRGRHEFASGADNWDWLEQVDDRTAAAWQAEAGGWAQPREFRLDEYGRRAWEGEGPDSWAAYIDDHLGQPRGTTSSDTAARIVQRQVQERFALGQVQRGYQPWWDVSGHFTDAEWAAITRFPDEPVRTVLRRREPGTGRRPVPGAVDAMARALRDLDREVAIERTMGPEPPSGGPWLEMGADSYAAVIEGLAADLDEALRGLDPADEWGTGPGAQAFNDVRTQWRQMVPDQFEAYLADGFDPRVLHQRLVEQHQRWEHYHTTGEVPPPRPLDPADVAERAAAATRAVETAETAAFEALANDLRRSDSAGRALRPGERDLDLLRDQHPDAVPIYQEYAAQVRQLGQAEGLRAAWDRAARSLERQPTPSEQAGRAVTRAGDRLISQGQRLSARAEAARAAGDTRMVALADEVAGRLTSAGERRGRMRGERSEAAHIAARLGHDASVLDRRARPVLDRTAAERAQSALEDRLARKIQRDGTRIGRAEQRARDLEDLVRRRERSLAQAEARYQQRLTGYEAGPLQVAPGPYRTVLLNVRRAQQELRQAADDRIRAVAEDLGVAIEDWATDMLEFADDPVAAELISVADHLPDAMVRLHSRGIYPEYLPGALDELVTGGQALPSVNERLPRSSVTSAEQATRLGRVPTRYRTVVRELATEANKIAENLVADRIITEGRWARPASRLLDEHRASLGPDVVDDLLRGRSGDRAYDIGRAMDRAGYTAWNPESPWSSLPPERIGLDTLFVPTPVFREFRRWFKPDPDHWLLKAYDYPTRAFKHSVLALNPFWHWSNILGNVMLATIGAGVPPTALLREGWKALKDLTAEGSTPRAIDRVVRAVARDIDPMTAGRPQYPGRLYDAGTSAEFVRLFADQENLSRFSRVLQTSYNFNNFVDNLGRTAVYRAKRGAGWSTENAVKAALDSMGDFARMTHFERNVVRRIIPFYAWLRHVAQITTKLPVQHPYRVAAMLHVANLYRPELPEGTPEWLQQSIYLGDNDDGDARYFNLASANAFLAGMTPLSAGSGFAEMARTVNPLLQLGGAALGGFNVRQWRPVSRPPGTGTIDYLGREGMGPMAPREIAYWVTQQTPQLRMLADRVGPWSDPVLRYDQGDPIVASGRIVPRTRDSLLAQLGIPQPMTQNITDQRRRAAQRRRALEAARRRYRAIAGR